MKAVVYMRYGSPDLLQLEEVPEPTPKRDEVLIEACFATPRCTLGGRKGGAFTSTASFISTLNPRTPAISFGIAEIVCIS